MSDLIPVIMMLVYFAVYGIVILASLAFSIAVYVVQSVGLYTLAKRRGLRYAWLAWLPVGNSWITGSLADDYRSRKGKKHYKLGLFTTIASVAVLALAALFVLCFAGMYVWMFVCIFFTESMGVSDLMPLLILIPYMLIMAITLLMSACSLAHTVLCYVSSYFIFESCVPEQKVLYLIIAIVVGYTFGIHTAALGVTVFLCRNKDLGMPVEEETAELAE